MGKFFTKYLPVEGEPREGYPFLYGLNSNLLQLSYDKSKDYWFPEPVNAQLFLCSRDIKVGDKVKSSKHPEDKQFQNSWNDVKVTNITDSGVEVTGAFVEGWVNQEGLYKVLGPISKRAIWAKEGQQFEEDDIWISEIGGSSIRKSLHRWLEQGEQYDPSEPEYPIIYLPCPACGALC